MNKEYYLRVKTRNMQIIDVMELKNATYPILRKSAKLRMCINLDRKKIESKIVNGYND